MDAVENVGQVQSDQNIGRRTIKSMLNYQSVQNGINFDAEHGIGNEVLIGEQS